MECVAIKGIDTPLGAPLLNMYHSKHYNNKALNDVIDCIKDKVTFCIESDSTPVFSQKLLTDLYKARLTCHGADQEFTKRSHCTRLREQIMEKVPGLRESRDGRKVFLSIVDDIGKALFIACENSVSEEKRILSKTAKLIRNISSNPEKKSLMEIPPSNVKKNRCLILSQTLLA